LPRACGWPPLAQSEETMEARRTRVCKMFQEFVHNLHKGMYLTHINASYSYNNVHFQLMDDLRTLKTDQCDGRIVEFPLTAVSKVRCVMRYNGRWYSTNPEVMAQLPCGAEHIIVVELFKRRQLAFVFHTVLEAQCFMTCMELLIRNVNEASESSSFTPPRPLPSIIGCCGRVGKGGKEGSCESDAADFFVTDGLPTTSGSKAFSRSDDGCAYRDGTESTKEAVDMDDIIDDDVQDEILKEAELEEVMSVWRPPCSMPFGGIMV